MEFGGALCHIFSSPKKITRMFDIRIVNFIAHASNELVEQDIYSNNLGLLPPPFPFLVSQRPSSNQYLFKRPSI